MPCVPLQVMSIALKDLHYSQRPVGMVLKASHKKQCYASSHLARFPLLCLFIYHCTKYLYKVVSLEWGRLENSFLPLAWNYAEVHTDSLWGYIWCLFIQLLYVWLFQKPPQIASDVGKHRNKTNSWLSQWLSSKHCGSVTPIHFGGAALELASL